MIAFVDRLLNGITMYRLVLYALTAMAAVGVVLDVSRLSSLVVLLAAGWIANRAFAKAVGAAENAESVFITAYILFLILFPASTVGEHVLLALVAAIAMASKYLFTVGRRHVFNPAAFGAVAAGLCGWGAAWWVGSAAMLPVVAVGGLLVARKTRRMGVFGVFLVAALAGMWLSARWFGPAVPFLDLAREGFVSWPLVFFGTVMLTEPLTLPASRAWQMAEAVLVGLLFAMPFSLGPVHASPELALLIGNLFALADGVKRTYRLRLVERSEVAPGVYDLAFESDAPLRFRPGQYLEWTLPHAKPDQRGARRTFTVASSPGENRVRLGVRVPAERPSSFKRALLALKPGETLAGSNVAGEFTVPRGPSAKLAFIAGGIGVTPFRSMVQDFTDRGEKRDAVLFYACKTPGDFAYREVFDRAASLGVRAVYLATDRDGYLTEDALKKYLSDAAERTWYLSGPPAMVNSYKTMLRAIGVARRRIHTDYFPGY